MFNKKTIRDIDVNGKKVLVRVDFNVHSKTVQFPMTPASAVLCPPSSICWTTALP